MSAIARPSALFPIFSTHGSDVEAWAAEVQRLGAAVAALEGKFLADDPSRAGRAAREKAEKLRQRIRHLERAIAAGGAPR